ncbi:MAG: transglycosylase SLT domain-containing protein, partial [Acidocella sp.]|nr:transglycosylase SLT domain-containing protein [Acidocella sp.]
MIGWQDNLTGCAPLSVGCFVGLIGLLVSVSQPAQAASASAVSTATFSALADRCAPSVPEWMLSAVARTESNFHPWMLHDNTARVSDDPPSLSAAETEAAAWMAAEHSVDLGLMQINSSNLPALGMTVDEALDPCASLAAGAAVLRAAYGGGPVEDEQQTALLMALS